MLEKTKAWISAFRLRTLPLSFSVVLMGSAIALETTRIFYHWWQDTFSWLIFTLTMCTTLFLQILSNLANDYGDALKGADNEGRIGPERAIQSGLISNKEMLAAILLFSLLSLISGIWLLLEAFNYILNWTFILFFILGLLSIAAAIKYTVGKRAYGYSGLGDLFVFIFFGLIGVIGSYFLQDNEFRWIIILPAITMGCLSATVLNLNNMRDRENDQKVGKITLAVKLGFKRSKVYHYILFVLAYLSFPLPLIYVGLIDDIYLIFIPVIPVLIIHLLHIRKVIKIENPVDFDPELKKVALSTFLFAILFFAIMFFIH